MAKTYANQTQGIVSGTQDEDVKDLLSYLNRDSTEHDAQINARKLIVDLLKSGCIITSPDGTQSISSKLIVQILQKVVNKMKIPDSKIYKAGPFKLTTDAKLQKRATITRQWQEQIVTAGVFTVMKEGKFIQCMRDKGGVFYKIGLLGDAQIQIGYDEDNSDCPIRFRVLPSDSYRTSPGATDIRDVVEGNSADYDFYAVKYTMKRFEALWPDFKGKVAPGMLPIGSGREKELEKKWNQVGYNDDEEVEVGYFTCIDKRQIVIAGAACTVLRKLKGDLPEGEIVSEDNTSFPYVMDGKAYLPTLHFKYFPSPEGYSNWGIVHLVYDIALLAAKMDNDAYLHTVDNIRPITLVNTTNKSKSKLFADILKAEEAVAAGGRGYVVSENPQGTSGVSLESFQTNAVTNEWERAFTKLDTQIKRLGFELDAPNLGSSPNQMSIMSAQENADAPIKQVIEYNSTAFEEAILFTMDFIRKFVPDDDQTPLNSMVDIDMTGFGQDLKMPLRGIPLGMVAQELRANKYFVVVNSRDGTMPSNVMELAKARETMSSIPQGTPAWNKMAIKVAQLNGHNIGMEDLGMPQPGGAAAGVEAPASPMPTETSPLNAVALKYGRT